MNNEYKENEQYSLIGKDLIENEDAFELLKKHKVKIAYMESSKPAGKSKRVVLGECIKLSEKDKNLLTSWRAGAIPDYFIVIYKDRIKTFSEEQIRILIMHELMHIDIKEGEDGSVAFRLKKHDLEDFREIVDRFGMDWAGDGQITWQQLLEDDPDPDQKEVSGVA